MTSPGYVGMKVTISGTDFLPNRTVTVTYTTTPVVLATTTTDAMGAFSVTVTIPPSQAGNHTISVTDGANTRQFPFVMESTPPSSPAPLKPEMGAKAKAEAYFDWTEVTDPSGVTYTLQIANGEEVFNSEAAESFELEKTGLTLSEYTLTKNEKLQPVYKPNPLYWRVKAVDGASNESEWSEAQSFYTGFQWPEFVGWPLYLVIGVGGVLLFIFGFWMGRRTAYY